MTNEQPCHVQSLYPVQTIRPDNSYCVFLVERKRVIA